MSFSSERRSDIDQKIPGQELMCRLIYEETEVGAGIIEDGIKLTPGYFSVKKQNKNTDQIEG